ncbi:MAG: IS1634 family transposase, partial [bacterium]
MFLRTVKAAGGKGVQHEYVRLVESYRENGRNKQRVVCNLGRKDLLAAHLDSLIRLLEGQPRASAAAGDVRAMGAW